MNPALSHMAHSKTPEKHLIIDGPSMYALSMRFLHEQSLLLSIELFIPSAPLNGTGNARKIFLLQKKFASILINIYNLLSIDLVRIIKDNEQDLLRKGRGRSIFL